MPLDSAAGTGTWGPLDAAIDEALAEVRAAGSPPVVLFSGGVDSALLAWELRTMPGLSAFTVGLAGAPDLGAGASAAGLLGVRWAERRIDDAELERTEREVAPELGSVPPGRRSIFVALAAAMRAAPAGLLVCGQGADELFLGYAHFRGLTKELAASRAGRDLQQLERQDWPLAVRLARRLGRELRAPYLSDGFVAAARAIPIRDRLPAALTKPLFRRWAAHRGLPVEIAARPKRAIQFGSGVDRRLRERARTAR